MKNYRIFWLLCLSLTLMACDKKEKEFILTVASERYVLGETPCYIVKFDKSDKWTIIGEAISGLDYEPGNEYVVSVKKEYIKNPPQDYLGAYIVQNILSKTKKQSENLPPKPDWGE